MFSGGALERLSIFALGVMPYISASIIMQMLAVVVPAMRQSRRKARRAAARSPSTRATVTRRAGDVPVASARRSRCRTSGVVINPGPLASLFTGLVTLVTGTMFLMWLGEQITERGIGNGISMIIFAGIVAGCRPPSAARSSWCARRDEPGGRVIMLHR